MRRPTLKNYITLAITSLSVWVAALIHRAMLVRFAGGEALGLYQMTFPAYRLITTVVTVGLPVVLTTLTAGYASRGRYDLARRTRNVAAGTVLALSCAAALVLWLGRGVLVQRVFPDPRVGPSITFMPIALVFSCEAAVLHAFFQGLSNMTPFAVSQAVEQTTRLLLTAMLVPAGRTPEIQAAGAMAASAAAEAAGFISLLFFPSPKGGSSLEAAGPLPVFRSMVTLSFPLMMSGFLSSALQMVNVVIIPRRLFACGFGVSGATSAVGELFGMALPIVFFPMVLVIPMANALLPVISGKAGRPSEASHIRRKLAKAYLASIALGVCTSIAVNLFGARLTQLLYGTPVSTAILRPLSLAPPLAFTGVLSVTILNAVKKNYTVLLLTFFDALFETFFLYMLTTPRFGGLCGTTRALLLGWVEFALASGVLAWRTLSHEGVLDMAAGGGKRTMDYLMAALRSKKRLKKARAVP